MRWNLLKTFDKIYTIDLHGNTLRQEVCPDGSKDENVFDIMQGVSINILVKTGKKKAGELGKVYHYDLYGRRDDKYKFLRDQSLENINFVKLPNKAPNYFMVQKDFEAELKFQKGFAVNKIFNLNSAGIVTARDSFTIHFSKTEVAKTIDDFLEVDNEEARKKFNLGKDVRDWKVEYAREDLKNNYPSSTRLVNINYRPFDSRWTFYTGNSKGFHCYPRNEVMSHFLESWNVGLILPKQVPAEENAGAFITKYIAGHKTYSAYNINSIFPLYLYPEEDTQTELLDAKETPTETPKRVPNLDPKIVADIASAIGLTFTAEKTDEAGTFAPIDILDYIYAVLHSPTYRETYKEFLKIDFPRVPYPSDVETFWQLVALGGELRQIHLLESPQLKAQIKTLNLAYPKQGDNSVTRKMTTASIDFELNEGSATVGKVWINDEQYFDNVPLIAWEFYIGGYQPAQKWLKDRRERSLDHNDVAHYMNIIAALSLTDSLMQQIDAIDVV